jgi:hypothetical protein
MQIKISNFKNGAYSTIALDHLDTLIFPGSEKKYTPSGMSPLYNGDLLKKILESSSTWTQSKYWHEELKLFLV